MLECAANLACAGAEPLGLTNCLNFGNPEKPHIAWQLTRAVDGIADACRALDVPVVGGNVSLYNEGGEGPIYPTPVVGMVGELPDARDAGRLGFAADGDAVGDPARLRLGAVPRRVRALEAARRGAGGHAPARRPGRTTRAARRRSAAASAPARCSSAHDIAEGGLAIALAECCIASGRGATVDLQDADESLLFGEGPGAFVVSGPDLSAFGDAVQVIGTVGGDTLSIDGTAWTVAELAATHADGLTARLT